MSMERLEELQQKFPASTEAITRKMAELRAEMSKASGAPPANFLADVKAKSALLEFNENLKATKQRADEARSALERMAQIRANSAKLEVSENLRLSREFRNAQVPIEAAKGYDVLGRTMQHLGIVVDPVSASFQAFHIVMGLVHSGLQAIESIAGKVAASMERLDQIAKVAKTLGIDEASLTGLRRAAQDISGVDAGQFDASFRKMGVNIGEAAMSGKGPAAEALDRIGLSAQKLSGMSLDKALLEISDALQKVENVDERLALSKGILGKGGEQLATTLAAGGTEIRKLIDDQTELSKVKFIDFATIESANDQIGRLTTAMESIVDLLASDMAPLIRDFAKDLAEAFGKGTEEGKLLRDVLRTIAFTMAGVVDTLDSWEKLSRGDITGAFLQKEGELTRTEKLMNDLTSSPAIRASQNISSIIPNEDEGAAKAAAKAAEHSQQALQDWWNKYFDALDKLTQDEIAAETKRIQEIADKGEKLADSLKTPTEKLQDQFTTLQEAFANWSISPETFQRGLEDLMDKAEKGTQGITGAGTTKAIGARSIESVKLQYASQDPSLSEAKKQTKNQDQMRQLLSDIKDEIAKQAPMTIIE
jgi:hypothetical protein